MAKLAIIGYANRCLGIFAKPWLDHSGYMVLVETEQKILVMRPYQIYAVKAIVDCIEQDRGNGYIWHTTGSGKTCSQGQ